jgi:hypothetical protein
MNKYAALTAAALMLISSQTAFAVARVAVGHFAPFADALEATTVNIAINGAVQLEGVQFKQFTDYLELDAGDYTIDVIPVGATDPAITQSFSLADDTWYTVYAQGNGTMQPLELRAMVDNVDAPADGNLNIRVVHAAPFAMDLAATEVSIRTAGGDIVNGLQGVPYNADSGFFQIAENTYDLKVASNDGYTNYIDPLPAPLPAGADITVFAVGDGVNQPLAIIAFPLAELPLRTPVDNRYNGMWGIQEGSGTGFVAQPMPKDNRLVGTWYTYDETGNPTFLTFDSCQDSTVDENGLFVCGTPGAFDGMTATTGLWLSTGGGPAEDDVVSTEQVGTIDFLFIGCHDAFATVTLDGQEPQDYTGVNLTRPFPCVEAQ